MKFIVPFCIFAFIALGKLGHCQDKEALIRSIPIKVTLHKMNADGRGTDVENIYTIVVEYTKKDNVQGSYNILYYLDDVYTDEFKARSLPYSFARNFKGQDDRVHTIRIDLEDRDLKIVGRQTATINVQHKKIK
jgi:hypothetical protein